MAENGAAVVPQKKNGDTHGQALTGKQEHCTSDKSRTFCQRVDKRTDIKQISNVNSFPNKSNSKSQSSTLPPPYKDSAHLSDQSLGR
jgi:hypothetical protein